MSIRAVARFSASSVLSMSARYAALLAPVILGAYALQFANPAQAQTPPKATFCAAGIGCYDTMEKAADAIRNSKDYQGIGQYLKAYSRGFLNRGAGEVWTYFRVPSLKATSVSGPSYGVNLGIYGVGNPGCTPSPEFGSSWCTDEGALIAKSLDILTTKVGKSCSLQSNVQTSDYNTTGLGLLPSGDVSYSSDKYFTSTFNCPSNSGAPVSVSWRWNVYKKRKLTCEANFTPFLGNSILAEAALTTEALCKPKNDDNTWVTSPLKQFQSCSTNNPCHPTTGDKSREEKDFEFAGRSFNRYYHSVNQTKSSIPVGEGWSLSYSDRFDSSNTAYLDEAGNRDVFTTVAAGTGRAQNSGRLYRRISNSTTYYRVIEETGEYRDFGKDGQLLAVRNPASPDRDVTVVYEGTRIARLVDGHGRAVTFTYTDGRVTGMEIPGGGIVLYDYDVDGNLIVATYPDGAKRLYHYHEKGLAEPQLVNYLTGITGENGQRYASFGYDTYGRVISSVLHGDTEVVDGVTLNYVAEGVTEVTQASGAVKRFEYGSTIFSPVNNVTEGPASTSNTYFSDGRLKSVTDASGSKVSYEYAPAYQSAVTVGDGMPEAVRTESVRDALTHQLTELNVKGAQGLVVSKRWTRNERGQALTQVEQDAVSGKQRQQTFTYCEQADVTAGSCPLVGVLLRVDGARTDLSDATTYDYYPAAQGGDLKTITNAVGQVTQLLSYDSAGRVLSQKDPNGVVTDYSYDARGRLTASMVRGQDSGSETDDRITRYSYWPTGLVKQVALPGGDVSTFTYDSAFRLTRVSDRYGNSFVYTLDTSGHRIKEDITDAKNTLLFTVSRIYDELGRLKTQADAQGNPTDFTYDAVGTLKERIDAMGRSSTYAYDALHRLKQSIEDTSDIKATSAFQYDVLGQPSVVTDPKGLKTTYKRNGLGELLALQSPDTGSTGFTYDDAGNVLSRKDAANRQATYTYDALNRPVSVTYADAALETRFVYDVAPAVCVAGEQFAAGRLASMKDGSGTTQYCYNRFGDLVRKVQTTNGKALTVRYAYTAGGNLTSMVYPDGAMVDYVRNELGQIAEVGYTAPGGSREVLVKGATYLPMGPVAGWTYGNGRVLTRAYDQDYRPKAIQDKAVGGLDVGFGFDAVGNLTALTPAGNPTPEIGLGYDTLGRLIALTDGITGTVIDGYSYDATGNRLSAKVGSVTQAYTYPTTNHRLSAVAGVARTYDKTGNTLSIGGKAREFPYDASGRMSMVKRAGVLVMNYRYNGKGEQVRRFLGTTNTYTLYDESGHWLGDYDNNGVPKQQVIWLDDLPVGLLANANKLHYIEPDHLGSPRVVVDPVRNVAVWSWSLKGEAFGNTAPNQDPDGDGAALVLDMRFPGQRFDAASGLNQNYFRDYDSATGRYGQSDPLGLRGGISTYAYVGLNPFYASDLFGLESPGWWSFPPGKQREEWRKSQETGYKGDFNAQFGVGASYGNFAVGGSGEAGIALDTAGAACFYVKGCGTSPVAGGFIGGLGGSVGMSCGTGNSSVGKSQSMQLQLGAMEGAGAKGSVELARDGNASVGINAGIGAQVSAGFQQCQTRTLWCTK